MAEIANSQTDSTVAQSQGEVLDKVPAAEQVPFDGDKILRDASEDAKTSSAIGSPSHESLAASVSSQWETYRAVQRLRNELGGSLNGAVDADEGKAIELRQIESLDAKDMKVIGGFGEALKEGNAEKAKQLIIDSYDAENYGSERIDRLEIGMNAELHRRGMDKQWQVSLKQNSGFGFPQANLEITDLRNPEKAEKHSGQIAPRNAARELMEEAIQLGY